MKKLYSLFLICSILFNTAFARTNVIPSIHWQKIELEKHITQKVISSINGVVERKSFTVDTNVEVIEPKTPDFYKSDIEQNNSESKASKDKNTDQEELKKKELEAKNAEKAKEKKEQADKDKSKGKIKPSDVLPSKLPQDYIVFSKLGLEAPLIDDFDNFRRETILKEIVGNNAEAKEKYEALIKSKENEFKNKTAELKEKLEIAKKASEKKISDFEQLWKYNSNLDIFKNLDKITILVKVDESIDASDKAKIKKYVENLNITYSGVKGAIKLSFVPFNQKIIEKDQIETVAKFANVLAAIFFAILLGVICFVFFRKIETMLNNLAQKKMALEGGKKDDDKNSPMEVSSSSGGDSPAESEALERFINYLQVNFISATALVRKWISSPEKKEISALKFLADGLSNDLLLKLFDGLQDKEREVWKGLLETSNNKYDKSKAALFVNEEIVSDLIVPSAIDDQELVSSVMKLSPLEVSNFIKDNKEFGKLFFNIFTANFLSQVMIHMNSDLVRFIIGDSNKFSADFVSENRDKILSLCSKYHDSSSSSPFVEKLKKLIYVSAPDQERILYSEFLKIRPVNEGVNVCLFKAPFSIISYLEPEVLSDILKKYEFSKRVDLLGTLDEELSDSLLDLFAPEGSKARDMYNFTVEDKDESYFDNLKEHSENIQSEFRTFMNEYFEEYDEKKLLFLKPASEEWLNFLSNKTPDLSLVS